MTPNEVLFGLITAAIIVLVVFLIRLIVRLQETLRKADRFIETADQSLGETVEVVRNLKSITDSINTVTGDMASFSGSVRDIGEGVKQLTGSVRRISDVVEGLGAETMASVCGLQAGLKTGFEVFFKNLFSKGGR